MMVPGLALLWRPGAKNMLSVLDAGHDLLARRRALSKPYSLAFTSKATSSSAPDCLFMSGIWDNVTGTFANASTFQQAAS